MYCWRDIKRRCERPDHKDYPLYGGRGIKVLFAGGREFRLWALANGWRPELVIDRVNNDGHYKPSNLRWVTWQESNKNRR